VPVADWADVERMFAGDEDSVKGWALVAWSRPSGAALDDIVKRLKALKLTMRNTPLGAEAPSGPCIFTGEAAIEKILIGRTY
jgi:prolyl-tRNA synthetase